MRPGDLVGPSIEGLLGCEPRAVFLGDRGLALDLSFDDNGIEDAAQLSAMGFQREVRQAELRSVDIRESIFKYVTDATFVGVTTFPCRLRHVHQDGCGTQKSYTFQLVKVEVETNPDSRNARFCTPVSKGATEHISTDQLDEHLVGIANSLLPGDSVRLEWNHDYITHNRSSGPERPVMALYKISNGRAYENCTN